MAGFSDASPAERARWLAELSKALDEACILVTRFALATENQAEVFDLYLRLEAARLEVQALRVSRSLYPRSDNAPERTELPQPDREQSGGD